MEKRPREYAAEIAILKTREERIESLNKVPEHLQALTRKHVEFFFRIKANNGA